MNGRQKGIFNTLNPIAFFDNALHAAESAFRSVPNPRDWVETEKLWRAELKIGDEVILTKPEYFSAGTPAWPVERVLQELDIPLQTLFHRAKELGKYPIDRFQFELDQQMMLRVAAITTAFMRCTSHSSIPKSWPRDKRQDFLGYSGGSCLAKTVTFLSELNRCMVFAFREIYDRDSEGRMTGIKPEIDEWGHPWLMLAFKEGFEQLRSCVFSRLKEENLEDVLGRLIDHLEDEVIAWQERTGGGAPSLETELSPKTIADQTLEMIKEAYPAPITSREIAKRIGKSDHSVRAALSAWRKKIPGDPPYESDTSGKHIGYLWKQK